MVVVWRLLQCAALLWLYFAFIAFIFVFHSKDWCMCFYYLSGIFSIRFAIFLVRFGVCVLMFAGLKKKSVCVAVSSRVGGCLW